MCHPYFSSNYVIIILHIICADVFLYAKISQLDFTRRSSIDKFAAVKKERQRKDHLTIIIILQKRMKQSPSKNQTFLLTNKKNRRNENLTINDKPRIYQFFLIGISRYGEQELFHILILLD